MVTNKQVLVLIITGLRGTDHPRASIELSGFGRFFSRRSKWTISSTYLKRQAARYLPALRSIPSLWESINRLLTTKSPRVIFHCRFLRSASIRLSGPRIWRSCLNLGQRRRSLPSVGLAVLGNTLMRRGNERKGSIRLLRTGQGARRPAVTPRQEGKQHDEVKFPSAARS